MSTNNTDMDQNMPSPRSRKKLRIALAAAAAISLLTLAALAWHLLFRPNVPARLQEEYVYLPTGSTLDDAARILKEGGFLLDERSFLMMSKRLEFKGRAGRFKISPGMSNFRLVRLLRSGEQSPVRVTLVNERLPEQVAAKVARALELDSAALMSLFSDTLLLDSLGYKPQTLMSMFIPNTYELFWTTAPRKFIERMAAEHDRFWKADSRQAKADSLGFTREQVYTLASIVERETNANVEKPRIAGVYVNRIKTGMPLQADPTLVFASRDWETRSLAQYKDLDSPYNTYKYTGLPPGPISMASIPSIDAVLNREKHDYVFFCAAGDGSGLHNFAVTYEAHKQNVEIYKANLKKRGL